MWKNRGKCTCAHSKLHDFKWAQVHIYGMCCTWVKAPWWRRRKELLKGLEEAWAWGHLYTCAGWRRLMERVFSPITLMAWASRAAQRWMLKGLEEAWAWGHVYTCAGWRRLMERVFSPITLMAWASRADQRWWSWVAGLVTAHHSIRKNM
jgi:hypothetical protein